MFILCVTACLHAIVYIIQLEQNEVSLVSLILLFFESSEHGIIFIVKNCTQAGYDLRDSDS
jgi:hypothetical protein